MMFEKSRDNKITGFTDDELDLINFGEPKDMGRFSDINKIGQVVNSSGEVVSKITPLIMVINASGKGWRDVVRAMVEAGADLDMSINTYYGKLTTAREIANTYRGGL